MSDYTCKCITLLESAGLGSRKAYIEPNNKSSDLSWMLVCFIYENIFHSCHLFIANPNLHS